MSFTSIDDDPMYESIGDAAHYAVLATSLLFAWAVARYTNDPNDTFFDEQWKRDGFCVQNFDVPYWNSHDVCMYYDTLAAVVMILVYLALRKTPGMERANEMFAAAAFGAFAHGLGHGGVGKSIREGADEPQSLRDVLMDKPLAENLLLLFLFWSGLMKAAAPHLKNTSIAGLVAGASFVQYFVPGKFGFTYVQTVLMMVFSLNQLARKKEEKDFIYASYPLIAGVPTVFIGLVESTQCTAFVKEKLYGHLIYDGFIPIATLTWYLVCFVQVTTMPGQAEPLQKKDKVL